MHQAAVTLLAAPRVVTARIGSVIRSPVVRVGTVVVLALALEVGLFGVGRPVSTVARPSAPILPVAQAAFTASFSTNRGLTDPVTIHFTTAMDPTSVAAALTVKPATAVALGWDSSATVLTVTPQDHWAVGTFETVTVQAGALTLSGQPLAHPARASFVTRGATTGSAAPTVVVGQRVGVNSAFSVTFARPVDGASVMTSMRLDPPAPGSVKPVASIDGAARYQFVPSAPLQPDTEYRLVVSGVRDADGAPLDTIVLPVRTVLGPAVVRFRPAPAMTGIARSATVSVRFTQAMDRRSTARAFAVSVGGKPVAGKAAWAEHDTVLVFTPSAALPIGATVAMDVGAGARNTAGVQLAALVHGTFKTLRAPGTTAPKPKTSGSGSGAKTGGSAVGGGSWGAVETYYLGLMNCTRTGGWVTSTGACSSPGGRNVAPLKLSGGISSKVSRPYAKKIAISGDCSHFIGGNPGDRLRAAGYTSYRWAENLGCRSGDARSAVLGSHLFFQAEKASNGGHYVNLMNAAYDWVGIGVWVSGGRVRLVIDFYHP